MAQQPPAAGVPPAVRVPDVRPAEVVVLLHGRLVAPPEVSLHVVRRMIAAPIRVPLDTAVPVMRPDDLGAKAIADRMVTNRDTPSRRVQVDPAPVDPAPDVPTVDDRLRGHRVPADPGAAVRPPIVLDRVAVEPALALAEPVVLVLAVTVRVAMVTGVRAGQERIVPGWVASARVCRVPVADDQKAATVGSAQSRRLTPNGARPRFARHADRVALR